jgi:hypothetical protein
MMSSKPLFQGEATGIPAHEKAHGPTPHHGLALHCGVSRNRLIVRKTNLSTATIIVSDSLPEIKIHRPPAETKSNLSWVDLGSVY